VVSLRDFSGTKESTSLSRSFQQQGIHLRLRKEPRASNTTTNRKKRPLKLYEEETTLDKEETDKKETVSSAVQATAIQRNPIVAASSCSAFTTAGLSTATLSSSAFSAGPPTSMAFYTASYPELWLTEPQLSGISNLGRFGD